MVSAACGGAMHAEAAAAPCAQESAAAPCAQEAVAAPCAQEAAGAVAARKQEADLVVAGLAAQEARQLLRHLRLQRSCAAAAQLLLRWWLLGGFRELSRSQHSARGPCVRAAPRELTRSQYSARGLCDWGFHGAVLEHSFCQCPSLACPLRFQSF